MKRIYETQNNFYDKKPIFIHTFLSLLIIVNYNKQYPSLLVTKEMKKSIKIIFYFISLIKSYPITLSF